MEARQQPGQLGRRSASHFHPASSGLPRQGNPGHHSAHQEHRMPSHLERKASAASHRIFTCIARPPGPAGPIHCQPWAASTLGPPAGLGAAPVPPTPPDANSARRHPQPQTKSRHKGGAAAAAAADSFEKHCATCSSKAREEGRAERGGEEGEFFFLSPLCDGCSRPLAISRHGARRGTHCRGKSE